MGITYDPASGGYAVTNVAVDEINKVDIRPGYTIKGFGDAEVRTAEKLIKFHKVLVVTHILSSLLCVFAALIMMSKFNSAKSS